MAEKNRQFTASEVTTAKTMLTTFAHESALFWTNAITSSFFMNEGTVDFSPSISDWVEYPNKKALSISGEQVIKFYNAFMEDSRKTIDVWVSRDTDMAMLLYNLKDRILGNGLKGMNDSYTFGGWDQGPFGVIDYAMKVAGINGDMKIHSPFRRTCLCIKEGKIYLSKFGEKKTLMMEVYKP